MWYKVFSNSNVQQFYLLLEKEDFVSDKWFETFEQIRDAVVSRFPQISGSLKGFAKMLVPLSIGNGETLPQVIETEKYSDTCRSWISDNKMREFAKMLIDLLTDEVSTVCWNFTALDISMKNFLGEYSTLAEKFLCEGLVYLEIKNEAETWKEQPIVRNLLKNLGIHPLEDEQEMELLIKHRQNLIKLFDKIDK